MRMGVRGVSRFFFVRVVVAMVSLTPLAASAETLFARTVREPPVIKPLYRASARAPVNAPYVNRDQYVAMRDGMKALLTRFPHQHHYYLGLGHSASEVIAFLQAVAPDLAQTFPASRLGSKSTGGVVDLRAIIDKHFAAYEAHFDTLLPKAIVKGQRKVLVIDYSMGNSPNNFRYALNRYLRQHHSHAVAESMSIRQGSGVSTDHQLKELSHDAWIEEGWSEFAYEEHTIHRSGVQVGDLRPMPTWSELVGVYRQWLMVDRSFDHFIREELSAGIAPD